MKPLQLSIYAKIMKEEIRDNIFYTSLILEESTSSL